jgi:thymidylate synthase (FAD)
MRIITEPQIYIVGRQTIDDEAVQRFLADHETSWQTDGEHGSELIVELAGRVCYMSLGDHQFRKTNADYINNLVGQEHGSVLEHAVWDLLITGVSRSLTHELVRHRAGTAFCLTGDTLIYSDHMWGTRRGAITKRTIQSIYEMTTTPHGRSRIKLLRLRCMDEATGLFVTGRVKQVVCSGVKPVFQVKLSDEKTITCSKEHRFLTSGGWAPLEEIVGGLTVTAHGIAVYGRGDAEIMVNGTLAYKDKEWLYKHYVEDKLDHKTMAALAGVSPHTIRSWIRKHGLQKVMGSWTVGVEPRNKGKRYSPGWHHSVEIRARLGAQKRGANNPQWRGGITRYAITILRGMKELRPKVFERDGYRCRLCGQQSKNLEAHHIIPIWARPDHALNIANLVTLCRPCHRGKVNNHEEDYVAQFGIALPDDVKATIFDSSQRPQPRVRQVTAHPVRIKAITFAGNQMTYDIQMEEPHHNFVANGIVTHNSQLSQRYVDESTADFVEPPIIASDPALHETWQAAIESMHESYKTLVAKLAAKVQAEHPDLGRTARMKMAREAARSVLPNATETKLMFSANARALRWIMTLRGGEGAEPEIRRFAVKLARVMREEAPVLFGDMEIVRLPDGSEGVRAGHQKV